MYLGVQDGIHFTVQFHEWPPHDLPGAMQPSDGGGAKPGHDRHERAVVVQLKAVLGEEMGRQWKGENGRRRGGNGGKR